MQIHIPSPDSNDYAALTLDQREGVRIWINAFRDHPVIKPITKWFAQLASALNVSPGTVKSKYYDLKKNNDWRTLVDNRLGEKPLVQCATNDPNFQDFFKLLCEQNQRSTSAAIRDLKRRWRNKETIPGYAGHPGWPAVPSGWSPRNLRRFCPTKTELSAMRFGIKTTAKHLPQIYSTRVGLWPAAFYQFDDVWHDNYIRVNNQVTRVIELGVLDVLSGCRFGWGAIPRLKKEGGGKHNLTEKDMRLFLASQLYEHGYNAQLGTTLVVENGTAAIREALERLLADSTGNMIKVSRSGIQGKQQAVLDLWGGRGGGNPRHKASLESLHNLIHNELASVIGQTGHDRNEPEMTHGIVKAQEKLLKIAADIPEARRELLQHSILDFHAHFIPLLADLYKHAINGRTDHNLQGWHELGFILTEYTALPGSNQWLTLDSLPSESRAIITNLAKNQPEQWSRTRKLSPLEVWENHCKPQLTKIPPYLFCDIIGKDHAVERKVKGAYFEFKDSAISPEPLIYRSKIITPEGRHQELVNGETYLAFSNPHSPKQLFICDAHYKCLGIAPRAERVNPADTAAVHAAYGNRNHRKAEILAPLRDRHAPAVAAKLKMDDYNKRVIENLPVTPGDIQQDRAERTANTRQTNKVNRNAASICTDDVLAAFAEPNTPPETQVPETQVPETQSPTFNPFSD